MSIFTEVFNKSPETNVFDLSHDVKMSLKMGDLVPSYVQEIVPGDSITMRTESLLRFAPLIAPVMHKIDVYQHFFFVPNRLVWSGWEDFITDAKPVPAFPTLIDYPVEPRSLGDYLGLPVTESGTAIDQISALPFAAYQMIYNEYYRDQNLSPEVNYKLTDGPQAFGSHMTGLTSIRKRAWQHDYFTAALPFAQKGDAVELPLGSIGSDVPVYYDNAAATTANFKLNSTGGTPATGGMSIGSGGVAYVGATAIEYDPNGTLKADTSGVELQSTTINDLRRAFRLQEWLEKNARAGTRYIETLWAHFKVKSSDARLQRPEYLGGSKQPMVISEVLQNSEGVETPQGNMAGHGVSVGGGKSFSYRAEEHGYIIGIISVIPKTAYSQGIPKHFSKFDKFDYAWPTFAHLGEQEVKNRELYYAEGDINNDGVWGYVPRYAEYKYNDSRIAGDFRSTLSFWHLSRMFATRPALNKNFIECNPDTRIFAVEDTTNQDNIYAHLFHSIKAVRKLPKYGTPEL